MTFIIKETIIMNFGGLLMRISIHIGVRNGKRLASQLTPARFGGS